MPFTQTHEQETGIIISTLNKCIALLPREKLLNVSRIGVSGQMHGVLFWKSETGKKLYLNVFIALVEKQATLVNPLCEPVNPLFKC